MIAKPSMRAFGLMKFYILVSCNIFLLSLFECRNTIRRPLCPCLSLTMMQFYKNLDEEESSEELLQRRSAVYFFSTKENTIAGTIQALHKCESKQWWTFIIIVKEEVNVVMLPANYFLEQLRHYKTVLNYSFIVNKYRDRISTQFIKWRPLRLITIR